MRLQPEALGTLTHCIPHGRWTSTGITTTSGETSGPVTGEALPSGPPLEKTLDGQLHPPKRWDGIQSSDKRRPPCARQRAVTLGEGLRPQGSEGCSRTGVSWGGQRPWAGSPTPARIGGWGGEASCVHVCVNVSVCVCTCKTAAGSPHTDLFLPSLRAQLCSAASSAARYMGQMHGSGVCSQKHVVSCRSSAWVKRMGQVCAVRSSLQRTREGGRRHVVQEFPLSLPLSRYRRPKKDSRVREACVPEWLRGCEPPPPHPCQSPGD